MVARLVDPTTDPDWARLGDEAPGAYVFHHPAWIRLLRRTYRYPIAGVCAFDGGRVVAGLPVALVSSRLTGRRLVALPFSDVCPPLCVADAPDDALERVAGRLLREREARAVRLEVRAAFRQAGAPIPRYLEHVLELGPSVEAVRRRIAGNVRRGANKARREGLAVERRTDRAALEAFYSLHLRTRQRLGVPTQPKRFIVGLSELFDEGLGYVALVRQGDTPAAAAVFLSGGGNVLTYKYSAADEAARRLRPMNLLFWEAVGWACDDGFERLDMGRVDVGQEGLATFKREVGADERGLAYTFVGGQPDRGHGTVDRALAAVITHTPPVVGRGIGELLYPHAG